MCAHFGWPHDFWRRMGWREFRSWLAELHRQRSAGGTSEESWAGREQDPFWVEQDRLRARRAHGR